MSYKYYGRRIVTVKTPGVDVRVLSGQWIGHRGYGNGEGTGTGRQRNFLLKEVSKNLGFPVEALKIAEISERVLWNKKGYTGDILN